LPIVVVEKWLVNGSSSWELTHPKFMMKFFINSLLMLGMFTSNGSLYGQTPPTIGANAGSFTLFTSVGALTNAGDSKVTGNIGTNSGAYSGFATTNLIGTAHIQNGVSSAAVADVSQAYDAFDLNACGTTLLSPLGRNSLTPGVYCTTGETSLAGDLTLDGQDNPNSIFIIKIGGAFSTASLSRILLINGASPANVYFRINGALTVGESASFTGIVISNGAIELLEAARFTGKALTTAGAVTLHNNLVNTAENPLPVTLTFFDAKILEGQNVLLNWNTTQESNSDHFEIQRSSDAKTWLAIGTVDAAGTVVKQSKYQYTDTPTSRGKLFYRLKMVDIDLTFAYSRIREVSQTGLSAPFIYPNPAYEKISLSADNKNAIERIQLINILGQSVYDQSQTKSFDLSGFIDISNLPAGLYLARLTDSFGVVSSSKVIKQ
jgi:hypothetical protein